MTRARDIADLVDANGDIVAGALDNVPAADLVNDTTPQLGGSLDAQLNDMSAVGNVTLGSHSPSTAKQIRLLGDEARIEFLNSGASYNVGVSGGAAIRFHRPSTGHEGIDFETHNTGVTHQATLKVHPEGYVTKPLQPAFRVARSSDYNHTASNAINFNKVSGGFHFNRGGHYSTSTYRFTAPVDGVYTFHCIIIWRGITQGADMTDSLRFQINGNMAGYSERRAFYSLNVTGNGSFFTDFITDTYELNANDYVTVIGQKTAIVHGNQEYSRWEGHLVG